MIASALEKFLEEILDFHVLKHVAIATIMIALTGSESRMAMMPLG